MIGIDSGSVEKLNGSLGESSKHRGGKTPFKGNDGRRIDEVK